MRNWRCTVSGAGWSARANLHGNSKPHKQSNSRAVHVYLRLAAQSGALRPEAATGTRKPDKAMISVSNVTMRYGSKVLFEDVSTTFVAGRRYGLTGPNGAGKSTFMKILTGELDAQKGTVVRPKKLGVLRQDQYAFDAFRVIDTVIMRSEEHTSEL